MLRNLDLMKAIEGDEPVYIHMEQRIDLKLIRRMI